MRTERQLQFARLEGMLMRHQVSTSDPAFEALRDLECKVGNLTSEQLGLIEQLIDRVVEVRNQTMRRKVIQAIETVEL